MGIKSVLGPWKVSAVGIEIMYQISVGGGAMVGGCCGSCHLTIDKEIDCTHLKTFKNQENYNHHVGNWLRIK